MSNTIAEIATRLCVSHPSQQLMNLSDGGGCWYDKLLLELAEIEGHTEDVATLTNYAYAGLISEEWDLMQSALSLAKALHRSPSSGKYVRNLR